MKKMTDKELLEKHRKGGYPYSTPGNLRFTARCSYLDGKTANAKEYNRRASRLEKLTKGA